MPYMYTLQSTLYGAHITLYRAGSQVFYCRHKNKIFENNHKH